MEEKPPIGDVILHYYNVTVPTGLHGRAKLKCPAHDDRHASASVDHNKNTARCFACDWGGDSWSIIMQNEGVGFVEAQRIAAENGWSEGSPPGWKPGEKGDNRNVRRVRKRRRRR